MLELGESLILKLRMIHESETSKWYLKNTAMVGLSPKNSFINYLILMTQKNISWTFKYTKKQDNSTSLDK